MPDLRKFCTCWRCKGCVTDHGESAAGRYIVCPSCAALVWSNGTGDYDDRLHWYDMWEHEHPDEAPW